MAGAPGAGRRVNAMSEITCAACGELTPAVGKFCIHCATLVQRVCPTCGEPVVPAARFCMQCATPLVDGAAPPAAPANVAERRLVSVLFADLVGFTTLSEHRDPEEVRDLLSQYFDRCRSLIELYGGTVEKFIGDAVMAVWGTPVVREDDAERAVRAALALTQAVTALGEDVGLPELRVRAGVLTGNAAVELGAEGEGMVLGDTVNTASRLQSVAAPGSVFVDDVTRRASEAAIDYEDAGVHQVKGREQPVHAFKAVRVVAGVGGARRSVGLEAPFVGRDRELETMIAVAEDTVDNKTARLVTVTGDAGTGKSRLLWEFFKYVDGIEATRWWHQGRCLAYGEGVSYWALAEMARARSGIAEEDEEQVAREKLQTTIERFVSDERERRLIEPRLAQLLGFEHRGGSEAADLFSGWRLFFERMADAQPVIMAFEDLQWADSGLLDFIDYLLEWSAEHPIFILALGRSELEARRPSWGTSMRLEPLPHDAMLALLDGLVPGLSADLSQRILERAEGVPLYAVETVRMLLDRGLLAQQGNRYVVSGTIDALEVPETLQALVAARLDNLEPAERSLLQDAAVLGISFTPAALAAVSERRESEVRRMLDALVAKQALGHDEDHRSAEQGQYHFLQALLRTIALSRLSRRDRKARHLAAADHLRRAFGDATDIAEVLASHYLDAVEADPEAPDADEIRGLARETLVQAGHRAVSLALGAEARRYFERAATLARDEPERAGLLAEAGSAAARTADREGARTLLTEAITALDAAARDEEAARTRTKLATVLIADNRLEQARELLEQAQRTLNDPPALADLAARRAQLAFLTDDFHRAREQAELALSIADPRELHSVVAEASLTKAIALYYDDRLTEAGALMRLGLEVAVDHDLAEQALRGYYNLADFTMLNGDPAESARLLNLGVALARERGDRSWERDLLAQTTQHQFFSGDWDEALALGQTLRESLRDEAARVSNAPRPLVFAARGELTELSEWSASPAQESEWHELALMETLGRAIALRALGDHERARSLVFGAVPELARINNSTKALYLCDVVDMLFDYDRIDLVQSITPAADVRVPVGIGPQLERARALLQFRNGEPHGERTLVEAIKRLRAGGSPFPLARGLLDLGELITKHDRPQEAAPLLHEARGIFVTLRATPWAERTERLLTPAAAA
jgi:class 3 adenylate cyclase/tetratricopeptide (TPR) repeat protein